MAGRYLLIEAKAIFDSVTILCLCDSGTALNTITKKAVPIKSSEIIWKIPKTNSGLSDLMPFEASKMFPLLSRHKARLRPVFPLVLGFLCHLLLNTIGRQIWLYKYYANFWRKSWQTEDQLCQNNTVAKWCHRYGAIRVVSCK